MPATRTPSGGSNTTNGGGHPTAANVLTSGQHSNAGILVSSPSVTQKFGAAVEGRARSVLKNIASSKLLRQNAFKRLTTTAVCPAPLSPVDGTKTERYSRAAHAEDHRATGAQLKVPVASYRKAPQPTIIPAATTTATFNGADASWSSKQQNYSIDQTTPVLLPRRPTNVAAAEATNSQMPKTSNNITTPADFNTPFSRASSSSTQHSTRKCKKKCSKHRSHKPQSQDPSLTGADLSSGFNGASYNGSLYQHFQSNQPDPSRCTNNTAVQCSCSDCHYQRFGNHANAHTPASFYNCCSNVPVIPMGSNMPNYPSSALLTPGHTMCSCRACCREWPTAENCSQHSNHSIMPNRSFMQQAHSSARGNGVTLGHVAPKSDPSSSVPCQVSGCFCGVGPNTRYGSKSSASRHRMSSQMTHPFTAASATTTSGYSSCAAANTIAYDSLSMSSSVYASSSLSRGGNASSIYSPASDCAVYYGTTGGVLPSTNLNLVDPTKYQPQNLHPNFHNSITRSSSQHNLPSLSAMPTEINLSTAGIATPAASHTKRTSKRSGHTDQHRRRSAMDMLAGNVFSAAADIDMQTENFLPTKGDKSHHRKPQHENKPKTREHRGHFNGNSRHAACDVNQQHSSISSTDSNQPYCHHNHQPSSAVNCRNTIANGNGHDVRRFMPTSNECCKKSIANGDKAEVCRNDSQTSGTAAADNVLRASLNSALSASCATEKCTCEHSSKSTTTAIGNNKIPTLTDKINEMQRRANHSATTQQAASAAVKRSATTAPPPLPPSNNNATSALSAYNNAGSAVAPPSSTSAQTQQYHQYSQYDKNKLSSTTNSPSKQQTPPVVLQQQQNLYGELRSCLSEANSRCLSVGNTTPPSAAIDAQLNTGSISDEYGFAVSAATHARQQLPAAIAAFVSLKGSAKEPPSNDAFSNVTYSLARATVADLSSSSTPNYHHFPPALFRQTSTNTRNNFTSGSTSSSRRRTPPPPYTETPPSVSSTPSTTSSLQHRSRAPVGNIFPNTTSSSCSTSYSDHQYDSRYQQQVTEITVPLRVKSIGHAGSVTSSQASSSLSSRRTSTIVGNDQALSLLNQPCTCCNSSVNSKDCIQQRRRQRTPLEISGSEFDEDFISSTGSNVSYPSEEREEDGTITKEEFAAASAVNNTAPGHIIAVPGQLFANYNDNMNMLRRGDSGKTKSSAVVSSSTTVTTKLLSPSMITNGATKPPLPNGTLNDRSPRTPSGSNELQLPAKQKSGQIISGNAAISTGTTVKNYDAFLRGNSSNTIDNVNGGVLSRKLPLTHMRRTSSTTSSSSNNAPPATHVQKATDEANKPSSVPTITTQTSNNSNSGSIREKIAVLESQAEKQMLDKLATEEYFGNCAICDEKVTGIEDACQAMDHIYHVNCFTCKICGRQLRGKSFYNVKGTIYCEEDFLYSGFQQSAEKCSICGHLIMEQILNALGKSYHPKCFRCFMCDKCLDGVPFTVDAKGQSLCVEDFQKLYVPKCAACELPIQNSIGSSAREEETTTNQIVIFMENDYHPQCYVCSQCNIQLSMDSNSDHFPDTTTKLKDDKTINNDNPQAALTCRLCASTTAPIQSKTNSAAIASDEVQKSRIEVEAQQEAAVGNHSTQQQESVYDEPRALRC